MSNPAQAAINLLNKLGWSEPSDMSMEEIAWSCGVVVRYKELRGCQGRIMMSKEQAIITVNQAVLYKPKINFIIAHEIGHAQLHRHLALFAENEKTLTEWYAQGPHEKEANIFATELLMPASLFTRQIKRRKLELALIADVADYFGASKTATFLRYRDLGEFPVMIIFIENGIIKWKSSSKDFPYEWLTLGGKLPVYTVAGDFYYRKVEDKLPSKVEAIEWFPDDYTCQRNQNSKVWEQCFPSTPNSIVTCLWMA